MSCSHSKLDEKQCNHMDLMFCPACQRVVCRKCGKEWGEKETQYISFYPYLPTTTYSPTTVNWAYN